MIHSNDYDMMLLMPTLSMEQHRNRPCELYVSALPQRTSKHFLRDGQQGQFEVLAFGYAFGKHQYFVRYPGFPHFVEMSGSASSHGSMESATLRNVVGEQVSPYVSDDGLHEDILMLFKHDDHAMITVNSMEFDFLNRIGRRGSNTKGQLDYGEEAVNEALSRKYIPIPELRNVEYAFKTEDGHLIVANSSAFNYSYEDIVVHVGTPEHGFMTAKISKFARYRDGGTTTFTATVMDHDNEFYSPTPFKRDEKATWNGKPMTKLTEKEIDSVAKLLNINRAPKTAKR